MSPNTETDRKTTTTARTVAKVAIAGMVVGAPLAIFAAPASAAGGNNWDAVAQCESGGNWSTNTGNGFSGGLQFTPSTWKAYGGQGTPQNASKSQQIQVAEQVLAGQGKGAWPVCGKALGAANTSANTNTAPKVTTKSAPKQAAPKYSTGAKASPQPSSQANTYSAPTATTSPAGANYVVKSGDTLSKIAQTHGVSGGFQALFSMNRDTVSNVNMIYVGQKLALS